MQGAVLTAPKLEDLSNEHEAGFGQRVLLPVRLFAVVGEVAVVLRLLLRQTQRSQTRCPAVRRDIARGVSLRVCL